MFLFKIKYYWYTKNKQRYAYVLASNEYEAKKKLYEKDPAIYMFEVEKIAEADLHTEMDFFIKEK